MMVRYVSWVVALCGALMAVPAPSSAADLMALPVDSVVSDGVAQMGTHRFPLPPGDWTMVAKTTTPIRDTGSGRGGGIISQTLRVVLVNVKDKVLRARIAISASLEPVNFSYWSDDGLCKKSDILYVNLLDRSPNLPECLAINHEVRSFGRNGSWTDAVPLWMERQGIATPGTVLVTTYQKYVRSGYVYARITVNPEASGQKPATSAEWGASEWHKDRINNDAERKAYVDKLIAWSGSMAPVYAKAFADDQAVPPLAALP